MIHAELIQLARSARHGNTAAIREVRKVALAAGYVGRAGGWIYSPGGNSVAHGWQQFASHIEVGSVRASSLLPPKE